MLAKLARAFVKDGEMINDAGSQISKIGGAVVLTGGAISLVGAPEVGVPVATFGVLSSGFGLLAQGVGIASEWIGGTALYFMGDSQPLRGAVVDTTHTAVEYGVAKAAEMAMAARGLQAAVPDPPVDPLDLIAEKLKGESSCKSN
jgi:hypothetical protein